MRIAILTTTRFHVLDLARELDALGHEVRFYSLLPPWRTARFGLPREATRFLGGYVAALFGAERIARRFGGGLARHAETALNAAVDLAAAAVLEPCDVLIAMSGIGLRTLQVARRRHGAVVFLERSSRHILSQQDILRAVAGADGQDVSDWAVRRELAGYAQADAITVPSTHVRQSFVDRGFAAERLFVNPIGVGLEQFLPTPAPAGPPTILVVGNWSLQKGCDVLTRAWRRLPGTRLVHVGSVGDAPLPRDAEFEHHDSVPQAELAGFYARAHVLALPSRQDGFGVVLLQALASGVPIVCSSYTGGPDLVPHVSDRASIRVVPPEDEVALADALRATLDAAPAPGSARVLLERRQDVGWPAYARRYEAEMLRRSAGR